ncbi:hypothetical protein [Smaragdicoccus niigatensis]|uniref:hypothetical protein n=1 Tax=Smaragdicoccus niigatensis TaxID=359359 RepID=UPI00037D86D7|nr:hypothetical protein [Smaragdicoccus niigatensis]
MGTIFAEVEARVAMLESERASFRALRSAVIALEEQHEADLKKIEALHTRIDQLTARLQQFEDSQDDINDLLVKAIET